jgi:hypothetical protein
VIRAGYPFITQAWKMRLSLASDESYRSRARGNNNVAIALVATGPLCVSRSC